MLAKERLRQATNPDARGDDGAADETQAAGGPGRSQCPGGLADERREPPGDAEVSDEPPPAQRRVVEAPPDPRPAEQAQPKRDGAARTPRRGAVTPAEATTAAQGAVPGSHVVTADLEIVRSRGIVTGLNFRAPAPDDPRYPWHGCAERSLEAVPLPQERDRWPSAGPVDR